MSPVRESPRGSGLLPATSPISPAVANNKTTATTAPTTSATHVKARGLDHPRITYTARFRLTLPSIRRGSIRQVSAWQGHSPASRQATVSVGSPLAKLAHLRRYCAYRFGCDRRISRGLLLKSSSAASRPSMFQTEPQPDTGRDGSLQRATGRKRCGSSRRLRRLPLPTPTGRRQERGRPMSPEPGHRCHTLTYWTFIASGSVTSAKLECTPLLRMTYIGDDVMPVVSFLTSMPS